MSLLRNEGEQGECTSGHQRSARYKVNRFMTMIWWRHQMETFSALLPICAGNSPVPGEFPTQRPVTLSFGVYFDLRPNKWWVNNREAGDLRRHRHHYEVIVMKSTDSQFGITAPLIGGFLAPMDSDWKFDISKGTRQAQVCFMKLYLLLYNILTYWDLKRKHFQLHIFY